VLGVIDAAIDTVRHAADAKGVQLYKHANALAEVSVMGDPNRLQQMVWNLLSNAIKFTPSGGRVDVTLSRFGEQVEITVADSGVGIDLAFLPHVFERFRQGDSSTTRTHGGLGLGLSIVRQMAEMHGGTVHAHSDGPGHGSTFRILLPVCPLRSDGRSSRRRATSPRPRRRAARRERRTSAPTRAPLQHRPPPSRSTPPPSPACAC
jgi:signal transduction histidine kinase